MDPASVPRLLTIAETAVALSCSEANVYSLINAGKLAYVLVGKRKGYRISADVLQQFVESQTLQAIPAETKPTYRPRLRHIRL